MPSKSNVIFQRVKKNPLLIICASLTFLTIISLLYLASLRESHGLLHTFDTGLYMQLLQNLLRDGDWSSSVTGEKNFLAHHFQPIIVFLLPFFNIYKQAFVLFLFSSISISAALIMLWTKYKDKIPSAFLGFFILAAVWHPSIVTRLFYSFTPEILALPFLIYQAFCLTKTETLSKNQIFILVGSQIFAGICKENIWLINSWTTILLIPSNRQKIRQILSLAGANLIVFLFLFLFYMPSNTTMPNYYALKYYANPLVSKHGLSGVLLSLIYNFFSMQSLTTFVVNILLLTSFLPLIRINKSLFAALPGMLFILLSSHASIHNPLNHYLIPCIPFLWVGCLEILRKENYPTELARLKKIVPIVLLGAAVSISFPAVLRAYSDTQIAHTKYISEDLEKIKNTTLTKDNPFLLVDGNLQPLLSDFANVNVILEFTGNPKKLTTQERKFVTDVITMVDLTQLSDCREIKQDAGTVNFFDYEAFYSYCEWIKSQDFEKFVYPHSRLIHFKLNKNT